MPRATERARHIGTLLDRAERERRCLFASTGRDAQALGRRARTGELTKMHRCLYARTATWNNLKKDEQARWIIRALAHAHPDWTFCLYSAAAMHGLPVSHKLLAHVHILTNTEAPSESNGLVIRHAELPGRSVLVEGIRVTPYAHTVIDCMKYAPFPDGLAIADAALRYFHIEHELLEEIVKHQLAGRPGLHRALRCASYADGRAESGGESIARAVMIDAGILPSDLQVAFTDPFDNQRVFRSDYLFKRCDGAAVLGELDGFEKYTDAQMLSGRTTAKALVDERQREAHLSVLGMPIVRFTMEDVWSPGKLVRLLKVAGVTPETLAEQTYLDSAVARTGGR